MSYLASLMMPVVLKVKMTVLSLISECEVFPCYDPLSFLSDLLDDLTLYLNKKI